MSHKIDQNGEPTRTEVEWVLNWIESRYWKQGSPLDRINTIYKKEVLTMFEGLKQALKNTMAQVVSRIHIY